MKAWAHTPTLVAPAILLMIGLAAGSLLLASDATAQMVANGDFEGPFFYDPSGVAPPDSVPNFWYKFETLNWPDPDLSYLGPDRTDNGPSGPGITSLYWARWNHASNGDWTAVEQDLNIEVSDYDGLWLCMDIKVLFHDLPGSGYTAEEWEFPVNVQVYFMDMNGRTKFWHYGWYQHIDHTPPNGYVLPGGQGIVYCRQVQYNWWYAESFDLLAQLRTLAEPVVITKIRVGGSGWGFEGKADNVVISGEGPTAVDGASWGSIKAFYRD